MNKSRAVVSCSTSHDGRLTGGGTVELLLLLCIAPIAVGGGGGGGIGSSGGGGGGQNDADWGKNNEFCIWYCRNS